MIVPKIAKIIGYRRIEKNGNKTPLIETLLISESGKDIARYDD